MEEEGCDSFGCGELNRQKGKERRLRCVWDSIGRDAELRASVE